jgi:hypothetical protein
MRVRIEELEGRQRLRQRDFRKRNDCGRGQ